MKIIFESKEEEKLIKEALRAGIDLMDQAREQIRKNHPELFEKETQNDK